MRADWGGRVVGFPAEFVRRYRAAGMWGSRTIAQEFTAAAAAHADRLAVVAPDGRLTYRELDRRTDRLAAGLARLGLAPRDPVLFQVTNRLGTIVAWYGVLKAGLVPVCTLASHRGHEIGEISRRVGAVGHVVDAGLAGFDLVAFAAEQARGHPTMRHVIELGSAETGQLRIETLGSDVEPREGRRIVAEIQDGIDADDLAVFQLSGGTTGTPKLIPRLHAEYWYNAAAYAESWGWDPGCRIGAPHPGDPQRRHHLRGARGAQRGRLRRADRSRPGRRPAAAGRRAGHRRPARAGPLRRGRPPGLPAVDGIAAAVVLSGRKVPPALFDELERAGVWSGQLFGMGEGLVMTTRPGAPREARATTVGTALSELDEVAVLEPGGLTVVPDGEVGELVCRGPYTLRGYFDAAEHNATAFTPDGYYRTGDLAVVREIEGGRYYAIEGRIKDLINRGGEKINAEEVELLLRRHPVVVEAAAVAMPDPRLGERTCVFVVTEDEPLGLADVQRHFAALQVAKFKWPERVEVIPALPRTQVGKIDKKALRAELIARLATESELAHAHRSLASSAVTSSAPPGSGRRRKAVEPAAGGARRSNGRNSTTRRELVESQMYEQAARLFAERGFAGTSLQDIADAMGVTRPALYYYVKSKDDLLAKLVTEITEGPAADMRAVAERTDLDAVGKLRAIARLIAVRQATSAGPFPALGAVRGRAARRARAGARARPAGGAQDAQRSDRRRSGVRPVPPRRPEGGRARRARVVQLGGVVDPPGARPRRRGRRPAGRHGGGVVAARGSPGPGRRGAGRRTGPAPAGP